MYDPTVDKISACLLFFALTIIMFCKASVFPLFHLWKLYFSFIVLRARRCDSASLNLNYTKKPFLNRIVKIHRGVIYRNVTEWTSRRVD